MVSKASTDYGASLSRGFTVQIECLFTIDYRRPCLSHQLFTQIRYRGTHISRKNTHEAHLFKSRILRHFTEHHVPTRKTSLRIMISLRSDFHPADDMSVPQGTIYSTMKIPTSPIKRVRFADKIYVVHRNTPRSKRRHLIVKTAHLFKYIKIYNNVHDPPFQLDYEDKKLVWLLCFLKDSNFPLHYTSCPRHREHISGCQECEKPSDAHRSAPAPRRKLKYQHLFQYVFLIMTS